jgi:hypothetical protein
VFAVFEGVVGRDILGVAGANVPYIRREGFAYSRAIGRSSKGAPSSVCRNPTLAKTKASCRVPGSGTEL